MGGGTFALWSDSASLSGATIQAGELAIQGEKLGVFDLSDESTLAQADAQEIIDLAKSATDVGADFLASPGDILAVAFEYTIKLQGDNLEAKLALDMTALQTSTTFTPEYWEFSYAIAADKGGEIVAQKGSVTAGAKAEWPGMTDSSDGAKVTLVLLVKFLDMTPDDEIKTNYDANAIVDLAGDVSMTLTQVR